MISLIGESNAGADGAAPVGKGVGSSAGSRNKRDRAPAAGKEIEMEQDDLDGDMDFINDIQDEIAHEILFVFPDNLTAPLTFSLWEHEVPFYEALQKLYKARNAKGVPKMGDIFSLSVGVRRGWVRLMPLHLMIGTKYLDKILELSPTGMWLLLDTNSEEMKWTVCVLKFYFGSEGACVDAKAIFEGTNAHLVACNPSGKMAHPLTIREPHGSAVRNLEGKIQKEKIPVPFFSLSKSPVCLLPLNSNACLHVVSIFKTMCKAPAPPSEVCTHELHPHTSFLLFLTPNNPEPLPLFCPARRQHQEGIKPLQQAIACAVEQGNKRLQQCRRRSVSRPRVYVCQITCTPLSRVQIIRSISSRWCFKGPRVATAADRPIRHGSFKMLSLSAVYYYNTTRVGVYLWVWAPMRRGVLGVLSHASKLFWSTSAQRSLTLRDVSIKKPASRISQLSITQNDIILQDTIL